MPSAKVGQKVFVKCPVKEGPFFKMSPKFEGPYRIVEILGKGKFRVKHLVTHDVMVVHWNRLKLIRGDVDPFFMPDQDAQLDTHAPFVPQVPEKDEEPVSARMRSKRNENCLAC